MTPCQHRWIVLAAGWLAMVVWSAAATIEFDIQPRAVQLGESVTCRITVRGAAGAPAPSLPPIPGFEVTSAGTEQNISITPAGQEHSLTYTYRLTPREAGEFTVGPFTYALRGDSVELPAVKIQVLSAGTAAGTVGASPQGSPLLFATLQPDRPNPYVQEPFYLLLSLYYSQGLNLDRDISLSDLRTAGIGVGSGEELPGAREVVSNQLYDVRRFRFPAQGLSAGTFTVAPRMRVNLIEPRARSRDPFFDVFGDFPFGRRQVQPTDIDVAPLQLAIRELPAEGRPSGFAGAVGEFTFDVLAQPTELRVGDPLTLTLSIRGRGNLDAVTPPAIVLGDGFRVYEPKILPDASRGDQRVFEQVIIPRNRDATEIPPIAFSFFNPRTERYETLVRGPFSLALQPATADGPMVVQSSPRPSVVIPEALGTDLVYLQPAPRRWVSLASPPWYARPRTWALQGFAPVLLALFFAYARRRDELARDSAKARRLEAPRSARAALVAATTALETGPAQDFFESVWRVLADYFGHRFNLAPGEVTREEVALRLHRAGLPAADIQQVREFFGQCEDMRFGGGPAVRQPLDEPSRALWRARLDELSALLRRCERLRR